MKLSSNDRWMVLSPGRTGSKVIVDVIRNIYHQHKLLLEYISPLVEPDFTHNTSIVLHSHKAEHLLSHKSHCNKTIISTRNMVESAISWVVQREIGVWHIYAPYDSNNVVLKRIKKSFDYEYFMEKYAYTKWWYETIRNHIDDATIVDYTEFENTMQSLLQKLNLTENVLNTRFRLPIKNPGSPQDWFHDWDSVLEKISTLETKPPL